MNATNDSILKTDLQGVYQTERYGNAFTYNIPVTNGDYTVRLHFAEIYWTFAGARVMNIDVENGQGKLSNFDIFATAGKNAANIQSFPIHVKDSAVTIHFSTVSDQAKISGIEIIPIVFDTVRQRVTSFTLVNAALDTDLRKLKDLDTLDFVKLSTNVLNIRANSTPDTVGSVVFNLSGAENSIRTESIVPYSLFGDISGNYVNWTPISGSYTLTATPYSGAGGTGNMGIPLTIQFIVTNDSSSILSSSMHPNVNDSLSNVWLQRNQQQQAGAIVYPNPSNQNFTMKLIGNETAEVKVFSSTGILIAKYSNLPPHLALQMGSNWSKGLYFAVIKQGKTTTVKKMIKR